jgi:hypothetical protein
MLVASLGRTDLRVGPAVLRREQTMVDRLAVAELFLAQLARTEDFIDDAILLRWPAVTRVLWYWHRGLTTPPTENTPDLYPTSTTHALLHQRYRASNAVMGMNDGRLPTIRQVSKKWHGPMAVAQISGTSLPIATVAMSQGQPSCTGRTCCY